MQQRKKRNCLELSTALTSTECGRCPAEGGLRGNTVRLCLDPINLRCWQDIWGKMSKDGQNCITDTLGKKLELNFVPSSKQRQLQRDRDEPRETITLGTSKLCAIRNLERFLALMITEPRKRSVCCLFKCIKGEEGRRSTSMV